MKRTSFLFFLLLLFFTIPCFSYEYEDSVPYNCSLNGSVSVGNYIYIFGGNDSPRTAYKYNVNTKEYTQLSNIPYDFKGDYANAYGTDIYLIYYNKAYKYDTLDDTYTLLRTPPKSLYNGWSCIIDDDIYFAGTDYSNFYCYKYNITNNSYAQISLSSYNAVNSRCALVGTDIYYFGGDYYQNNNYIYSKYAYKYDTINNISTRLTDLPNFLITGEAVAFGNNIYLFGLCSNIQINGNLAYIYNTSSDTYTQIDNLPYPLRRVLFSYL